MKRRFAIIVIVVLAAIIGGLAWWWPMDSGVPSFDRATVSLHQSEEERVIELSFAQREWLHTLFTDIPRDRLPAKWAVFATVRLFDSAGTQVSQIEVYSNSTGPGPFRIGEDYFLGYDQPGFREMLALEDPSSLSH